MPVTITPQEAAEALGIHPYDLACQLRQAASHKIEFLASAIRDSREDRGEYDELVEEIWRIVESAQACEAAWEAEQQA